jgi:hypothetical protein
LLHEASDGAANHLPLSAVCKARRKQKSSSHHSAPLYRALKLPLKHAVRGAETGAELLRVSERAIRGSFRTLMTAKFYLLKLFEAGESLPTIDHDLMQDALRPVCSKEHNTSSKSRSEQ